MGTVQRIYPESKTGLINFIEQNFHNIDEFIINFTMKDGTTQTIYDAYTYRNAAGMASILANDINHEVNEGEFISKEK